MVVSTIQNQKNNCSMEKLRNYIFTISLIYKNIKQFSGEILKKLAISITTNFIH